MKMIFHRLKNGPMCQLAVWALEVFVINCFLCFATATESDFLDAFLKQAVWKSELDWKIHVLGIGVVDIVGYTCFDFESSSIVFNQERNQIRNISAILGKSQFTGLGMKCELDIEVPMHSNGPAVLELDLSNGGWLVDLKFSLGETGRISNVILDKCESNFVFDAFSIRITNVGVLTKKVFESIYSAIAPSLNARIVEPMLCSSYSLLAETMSIGVQSVNGIMRRVKPPMNLWPRIHFIERNILPKSKNSSLAFAPYDDNLLVKTISNVVNELLGIRAVRGNKFVAKHDLVINKVIKERISKDKTGKISIDFSNTSFEYKLLDVLLTFSVTKIELENANTFEAFELFRPISKLTLSNFLNVKGPLDYALEMELAFQEKLTNRSIVAPIVLRGSISQLQIKALITMAIDTEFAGRINLEHPVSCLLSSIAGFELPRLEFRGIIIEPPRLFQNRFKSKPETLPNLLQAFVDAYVAPFMVGFKQNDLDEFLRVVSWYGFPFISSFLRSFHSCAPMHNNSFVPSSVVDGFLRMDSFPFPQLALVVNEFMSPPTDADFSLSRIMEILASSLSSNSNKKRKHKKSELIENVDSDDSNVEGILLLDEDQHLDRTVRNGMLHLNNLLHFGPVSLAGMFPSLVEDNETEPSFELSMGNLTVGPLNDIDFTKLFENSVAHGPYSLENSLKMNQKRSLEVKFDLRILLKEMLESGEMMTPAFTIAISMSSLEIAVGMFTRIAPMYGLAHFPIEKLFGPCFFYMFPRNQTWRIEELSMFFRSWRFKMECQDSPCRIGFTQEFVEYISTKEANMAMEEFILGAIKTVAKVMTGEDQHYFEGLNVPLGIDRIIADMQDQCAGKQKPKPEPTVAPKWIPPMEYFMLISALGLALQFTGYMCMVQRHHRKLRRRQSTRILHSPLLQVVEGTQAIECEEQSINPTTVEGDFLLPETTISEETPLRRMLGIQPSPTHIRTLLFGLASTDDRSDENIQDALYLLGMSKPLFRHPSIPLVVRYGVSIGLLVNFCIFVTGVSFFTMGAITIVARIGEERLKSIPMMTLTLDTCIDMMVEGRALLFALFIGLSSGLFPWIRVALLAFVWLAPPTVLPVERRGRICENLEGAGKWTLAEVYLFTVLMAVVSVDMTNPSSWTFIPPETFHANIECMPKWGLFIFLVAMWVSLILNHTVVHFHRLAKEQDLSILPWPVLPPLDDETRLLLRKPRFSLIISILLICWPICLFLALGLDTLHVRFLGFSGFGIDLMKESETSSVLSISLARLFPLLLASDPTHSVNSFGLFLICFGYALFILIAPVLLCALCLFIWHMPLYQKQKENYLAALRILNAWSTIEVLMCTLVVIVLQLHKFFDAMGGMITFLPEWIGPLLLEFGASNNQATGFGVEASLAPTGFAFLVLASLFGMFMPRIIYCSLIT